MTDTKQNSLPPQPQAQDGQSASPTSEFTRLLQRELKPSGVFEDPDLFNHAQRVAKMLITSSLAPEQFKGEANLGNAVIAVDVAFRLKLSPLLLMQQLNVIHGKPGFSAQFVIATINSSGKFSRLQFEIEGQGDQRGCVVVARELCSGEILRGTRVDVAMAKKQGWWEKNGSKWPVMTDQMLAYRAAAFWGRAYAPELLMGLQTVEELEDMPPAENFTKPIFESAKAPAKSKDKPKAVEPEPEPKTPSKPESKAEAKPEPKEETKVPETSAYNPVKYVRLSIRDRNLKEPDVMGFLHEIGATTEKYENLESLVLTQPDLFKMLHDQIQDFLNKVEQANK